MQVFLKLCDRIVNNWDGRRTDDYGADDGTDGRTENNDGHDGTDGQRTDDDETDGDDGTDHGTDGWKGRRW